MKKENFKKNKVLSNELALAILNSIRLYTYAFSYTKDNMFYYKNIGEHKISANAKRLNGLEYNGNILSLNGPTIF